MLVRFLLWKVILNSVKFDNYITFNDEGVHHIGRNILLKKKNIKTWYYAHSNSFGFELSERVEDFSSKRHWLWSFLCYDFYVGWNNKMITYQKLHHQEIGKYYNVGCLWSECICNNMKAFDLNSFLFNHGVENNQTTKKFKVISFFDTTFFDGITSPAPLADGVKFYKDVFSILQQMPDLFVIVKEKKTIGLYGDQRSYLYSHNHEDFVDILKKLRRLKNCCVVGDDADPVSIISISDLVVTYAFSSSTIEALGARKKAIFYDPMAKFSCNCYKTIPDFIANNYQELKCLIRKLLYKVTDKEYEEYLQDKILNEVEDYLDGKGITRFRELLVNVEAEK